MKFKISCLILVLKSPSELNFLSRKLRETANVSDRASSFPSPAKPVSEIGCRLFQNCTLSRYKGKYISTFKLLLLKQRIHLLKEVYVAGMNNVQS